MILPGCSRSAGASFGLIGKLVIITPNTASWGRTWFRSNWLRQTHRVIFTCSMRPHCAGPRETQYLYPASTTTVREADGLFGPATISNESIATFGAAATPGPFISCRRPGNLRNGCCSSRIGQGEELMMICESGKETFGASSRDCPYLSLCF